MAQQTAVEWLQEKFNNYDISTGKAYFKKLLNEAKQMEKEQQFRFFIAGQLSMEEGGKDFEQYYKKTYGKV